MNAHIASLSVDVVGLGLILYSPFAVAHIAEGQDYLEAGYEDPARVAQHVKAGTIVGIGTGGPGRYRMNVFGGPPADQRTAQYQFAIAVGLEVRDRAVCIRDLYDLMDWSRDCPVSQQFAVANGFYRVVVGTSVPASGRCGDNQAIDMYFEPRSEMPPLNWTGVPMICP